MELIDGSYIPVVLLTRYFKNKEGGWERCETNAYKYVTMDALMANYVAIDSPRYRYEKLNDALKPYIDIYENPEKPQACENLDTQESAENSADVKSECYTSRHYVISKG